MMEIKHRHTGKVLATIHGGNLAGADLSDINLSGADLSYASLSGADLEYADLTDANLSLANLSGANLSEALIGVNLPEPDRDSVSEELNSLRTEFNRLEALHFNLVTEVDVLSANLPALSLVARLERRDKVLKAVVNACIAWSDSPEDGPGTLLDTLMDTIDNCMASLDNVTGEPKTDAEAAGLDNSRIKKGEKL